MLINYLYVGLGGFAGASLRFLLSEILLTEPGKFPFATFIANILGCFLIGVVASHIQKPELRLLLITGVLGGFTTFSSFSYEIIFLFEAGKRVLALSYLVSSCILGVLACVLGISIFS